MARGTVPDSQEQSPELSSKLLRTARATTSRSRRSSIPLGKPNWSRSSRRPRQTGCVVTVGLGPRYLHSTGQLHKGGPADRPLRPGPRRSGGGGRDPGAEVRLSPPHRGAGCGRLRGACGRGRRIVRVTLEEVVADEPGHGRARTDGRQHDRAAARAPVTRSRHTRARRRSARRARSSSSSACSTTRASSG